MNQGEGSRRARMYWSDGVISGGVKIDVHKSGIMHIAVTEDKER